MKQAFILTVMMVVALQAGYQLAGYSVVYQIGYGAITLMSLMISLTFLWLYLQRATPLALGMAYSWSGAGMVMGWWWIYAVLGHPDWLSDSPLLFNFLALYIVGAVLHFSVIHRSLGLHGSAFLLPIVGAVLISTLVLLIR
ncbi:hypothetical protein [Aliiroseovarius subalbicans]|uniref:hypothetical protein n=1 Tax=Aliiroseovarius subalbicans TaxID=2925840 RepID=UPI001F565264|nr:hypothetical protein [Aliiroseovarius subalbicans]MCI2398789.1 hypothetical protein [Aliiroseovarius subalbicans]